MLFLRGGKIVIAVSHEIAILASVWATLIIKYVEPITQHAVKEERRTVKAKRVRVTRTQKPSYLRNYRRLKMVEWSIGKGKASVYPMEALDTMLESLFAGSSYTFPEKSINSSIQKALSLSAHGSLKTDNPKVSDFSIQHNDVLNLFWLPIC